MAKYTIELRQLCDMYGREIIESWFKDYNIEDYLTPAEINVINTRGTWNKDRLARKIVNNYFIREIGLETPALFKLYVKNKMEEIMEEKFPLIYSASIKYDPLVNVDYTETYDRNIDDTGAATTSSTNNATGLTVNSDTPQGEINKTNILKGAYASSTSAGDSEQTNSGKTDTQSNSLEHSTKNIRGNSGVTATAQAMIKQYREIIVGIDKEIIKELNSLFMGLF